MKKIRIETIYKIFLISSLVITFTTITISRLTTNEGIVLRKNLTVNFKEEVYIKDFIFSLDGVLIDNYKVDTSVVGEQNLSITFQNKYDFIVNKDITIEVKDITNPTIIVNNPYTVEEGTITNLTDVIFCADDYDDNPNCNIKGEYDLNKQGSYNLVISAEDESGNNTSKEFTLNVVKKNNNNTYNSKTTSISYKSILSKYKSSNTMIGLDLSKWQGKVDFGKLKEQGVDFVMLKIGGQTKINDNFNIDPRFYDNIASALENKIDVGIYFYSHATSEKEAINQANWIIDKLRNYNITLPIAFDWENWHNYTSYHLSFNSLNKIATSFIRQIEKHNYKGILYSSKSYLDDIWYKDEYETWIAYYNTDYEDYKNNYMWQLCNNGKIDGIMGYVDIDIMYKKR